MAKGGPLSRVYVENASEIGGSGGTTSTVSVSNFPPTQPVSGTVTVGGSLPAGTNALGSVTVTNFPASQAVTGTFWPATQPVSGSVSITGALPAGTNALGSVTVSNFPATTTTIARGTGSMATGQVAINQNAAVLVAAARATRRSITIVPTSQFTYFYGNAGVTISNGAAAPNGAAITLETTAAIYVVSNSSGTMTFVEHF